MTEKPGRLRDYANRNLSEPLTGVPKVAHEGQGGLPTLPSIPISRPTSGLPLLRGASRAPTA